ncbi:hypothetical protein [Lichenicoccus roseus]|uniref:Uncharacterized protein n=1 Tax=Lichenicoccus roseus TaxID=2683649 RepID=A0A5R9J816_9PROT|nr:hypothetical protein [Lichenicoccus roseus]TLU72983.1 hypothetical protein FE263_05910 [Lichenicoccus roseus]
MRVRVVLASLTTAGLLAGCVQKPPPPEAVAPNPFGYLKRSAACSIGPVTGAGGDRSVAIKARSDDGLCDVAIDQPGGGGSYASFVLGTLPAHGKAFIYNFNNKTYVTYTAETAYAGPDRFVVSLVPGGGKPRSALVVDVTDDATGVALPPPPAPAAPPLVEHARSRHRPLHHHHVVRPKTTD